MELEGCVLAQRPLENIICSVSMSHPSSSLTLGNFLLYIGLRKVGESTLSFLFGVNISQWNYSFGVLNAMESQHFMGKSVKWKSINAMTKWWHECIFFFQTKYNFALQIFVLGSLGLCFWLLLFKQQTPHCKPLKNGYKPLCYLWRLC